MRVLVATAALIVASGAEVPVPAFAQPARGQARHMVYSQVVSVRGEEMRLHVGWILIIPCNVAHPTEIEQGDTVRLTYEVKNGQKIATSIQFMDRPRDGGTRR